MPFQHCRRKVLVKSFPTIPTLPHFPRCCILPQIAHSHTANLNEMNSYITQVCSSSLPCKKKLFFRFRLSACRLGGAYAPAKTVEAPLVLSLSSLCIATPTQPWRPQYDVHMLLLRRPWGRRLNWNRTRHVTKYPPCNDWELRMIKIGDGECGQASTFLSVRSEKKTAPSRPGPKINTCDDPTSPDQGKHIHDS